MKKLISAVLLVACAGCDPAFAATYLLDLGWKDIEFTNSMALGESADIEIRNNGGAVSAGLMLYLTDRDKNVLALCTNMADGTLANSSIGTMNLATTNLAGKFDGASPRAEKTFDLSVWDAVENRLLASAPVVIRNNPLSEEIMSGWTNVPVEVTAELEASIAASIEYAQDAQFVASNAYALAYGIATTNEPLWTAASNRVLYVGDIAETAYGTETNTAYRGDWGLAVSNLAAQAAGWGDHSGAGYLTAETDPDFAAWLLTDPLAGYLTAEADEAGLAAAAGVQSNLTAHAEDDENPHAVTAEQIGALTEETDPAWTAASGSVVYATTPGYTAAVEQAATAFGWGDHAEAGYLTEEADAAALSAVAAVSGRVDVVESCLNGKIDMNNTLTSYIELVGTNLMFTATNGVTGRIQMIYE